ncbi:MAG: ATP-binding protein [candidate division KSB1 bacterium]|nr:ATP-binding protein [candidate division KSB1 bacterium]
MQDFEKLGVFYLGREFDLEKNTPKENLLLYDSKDLVTHAVCVGMTGSGKTGLCLALLEEAAIDGIPAILVDPKGDLPNLLLTFPDLKKEDFLPWINEDDARKKGLSPEDYAAKQAELWKNGLAEWGQDAARIRRLRDAAEFTVYTPGSSAGVPVSILKSFAAPEKVILDDADLLRERINTTVTSLLNLLGIEADPIQSREHILLSNILDTAWKKSQDFDLASFIQAIQSPPVTRIGVFDLESFFPSKDRFALAMKLNNLLAAPGFSTWLEGEPLDIDRIYYTASGKPRVAIFSIAHLNDAERMFFVSLLLTQLLGWMRTKSGTTSLRSLFYMDEIFGYFPPVANPPSKAPLMTLLKQARAFGLGIVLSTQNPVDLDYKGLSNTGTWFIGRLQTDRDKQRVLDGLEGAGASAGKEFNRRRMEQILAGLGNRVFLMNNVHEDEPVVFQTRWVMSYLRGPLTRQQIKQLMANQPVSETPAAAERTAPDKTTRPTATKATAARPVLPPDIPQYFLPASSARPQNASLHYEPMLLGLGKAYFIDNKLGINSQKPLCYLAEFSTQPSRIDWDRAQELTFDESAILKTSQDESASYGEFPPEIGNKQNYLNWGKTFSEWLYRNLKVELLKSPSLNTVSQPNESERDFRLRLQQVAREKRDALIDKIRDKYATRLASLEDRIRRAQQAVDREREQAQQQKIQTAISLGTTLLGAFLGRKSLNRSTLGRAATTVRGAGRAMKESKDIGRAEENVQVLQQQLEQLQAELNAEIEQIQTTIDPLTERLETITFTPKKQDISVSLVALAWAPFWQDDKGGVQAAW